MDAAPIVIEEFTTRASRDEIIEAVCRVHSPTIDIDVDGRRCTFGLVPPDATPLHVHIRGETVSFGAALARDVVTKLRTTVERRLVFGVSYGANTYTVSSWVERSPTLRDL